MQSVRRCPFKRPLAAIRPTALGRLATVADRPVLAVPGYSEIRQNQSFKPSPAEHRVAKSGCDGFVQAAASVITFSSSRDMRSSISAARCSCTG
jgi:hypothetical protein